ncbi:hypothetical protein SELMODRAFT_85537 [Selaginella moellendorffii]|uniref:Large ribosomal subunit protein mL43 n=1 Tax=Selaginella moellendorffii TaxID=88036 RepID=D8R5Y8_SELML|nr:NADH dehydrogenase [ubiquinone] 1 alpha subcomplex subunit 2 [Selaginella moellendorffii]XP_024526857.1 NADH dehydrogenase [ubiquinone] 1 alpha subcomplex subunit 2 [Selaginella moellendorffii]XP_024526858.1 NADH dehydrogenase [ubiquinone] 1 alpha subcomplex subunit 2 [Selaginella moellendorffii]XP_024526859.1 NADH dehydrogenase [ubiquinone] 1 alpha subcomplex subunit 2 [Selaginella moellendorffii]XP_024543107.1 NADH dehydrogenase [ubiquinone] 1 alpha subcomplex subunit 2 [Selaginella moelle|eukprot:XP_002966541.1 NADH dehydrogenase [ubiquinone] 1 alpha subcomplex subunit 2 [Selaginella moellendorffii]
MALRGVWQLKKLLVHYCKRSGGSRGARDFVETLLPRFAKANPQIEIEAKWRPHQDPYLEAFFLNKRERTIGLRNLSAEDCLVQAKRLRNLVGRRPIKRRTREISTRKSIQGRWTPFLKIT